MVDPPRTTINLKFFSDFWCPWCYIGYREIRAAIEKCQAEKLPVHFDVEYRPFLLAPALSEEDTISREEYLQNKLGADKVAMLLKMIEDRAKLLGITNLRPGPVRSTLRAHRLMILAFKKGGQPLQAKLLDQLFKAYSEDAKDLGDADVLADAALTCEMMSREEAVEFINSNELREEVLQMVESARANSVTGVPFTVINDKWAVSGGQTPDVLYQIFSKLAVLPPQPPQPVAPEPVAGTAAS